MTGFMENTLLVEREDLDRGANSIEKQLAKANYLGATQDKECWHQR
jgi:hypothetical protein